MSLKCNERARSKEKKLLFNIRKIFVAAAVNRAAEVDRVDFLLFLRPYHLRFHQVPDIFSLSPSLSVSLSLFIDCTSLHVLISLSSRFLSVRATLTSRRPAINQQAVVRVASS